MTSSVDVGETTWSSEGHVTVSERRYWTLVLVVIPALTLFGNALVVLSVWREMSLRTATNYFTYSGAEACVVYRPSALPLPTTSSCLWPSPTSWLPSSSCRSPSTWRSSLFHIIIVNVCILYLFHIDPPYGPR